MPNSSRFFGGDPSQNSKFKFVKPLPCSDFKEFFESQLFKPVRSQYTRAEFAKMSTKEEIAKVKWVRYFTPCTFTEQNSDGLFHKNNKNAGTVNLVCLDIDPEKEKDPRTGESRETGEYPAAPFVENPASLQTLLGGLNYAFYTTVSHTKDAPRARLIVETDNLPKEAHAYVVKFIAEKVGLKTITKESLTISQAMFRPTVFADTNLETEHPVINHNFRGRALTLEDLGDYKNTDSLKFSDGTKSQTVSSPDDMLGGLEYLTQPAHGVKAEDVKAALETISPDCNRDTWLILGMALRHQFQADEEEAFEIFDTWCSGSLKGKYDGREATRKWWLNHIKPTPRGTLPVTVRTLFKMAKSQGWDQAPTNKVIFERLTQWLKDCESLEELVDQGLVKLISSTLNGTSYEMPVVSVIKKQASTKFGAPYTTADLKKLLNKMRSDLKEMQRQEAKDNEGTPAWAKNLIYLKVPERIYDTVRGVTITKSSFDSTFGSKLLPSDQELQERGDSSRQSRFSPIIRPQDFVLNEIEIPKAEDVTYDPANPDEAMVKQGPCWYANTYQKSYDRPDRETSEKAGDVIKKHVALLIKENEYQRQLLDFIAYMVQHPGRKIRWAFLIQSAQGNGKGLLAKALRGVFGRKNIKTVDPEAIFSSFNDWACGSQIAILNEIRVTGHSRHDVMNKLKEPISDDHVSINQKFQDNREIQNVTNYLMFTNHKDSLAMEQKERRYFVVFSPIQTEQDSANLVNSGKLKPLQDLVDSGKFGGLRAFFEDWEISETFCPDSPPPKTPYFYQMADHAKPEIENMLESLLADESEPTIQEDIISASDLLRIVTSETNQTISYKVMNSILLSKGFKHLGRKTIANNKHQVWINPESSVIDIGIDPVKELERRIENQGEEEIGM